RIDPLVGVDPDHAGAHVAGEPMGPGQVASPQAGAEAVVGAIRDAQRLVLVTEGVHDNDRAEDPLSRYPVAGSAADDSRLQITAASQEWVGGRFPATEDRVALVI